MMGRYVPPIERKPVEAECKCRHRWTVAYIPMSLEALAGILRNARCPMCGRGPEDSFIEPMPVESD